MLLKTVFVRFYKSFNFDYLRKFHSSSRSLPWEMIDKTIWYPHVRIPIDPRITTVVGANESGKSHLLAAIEKGITGVGIEREDFCRYSEFYSVQRGKWKWPDFGFEWADLLDADRELVQSVSGAPAKSLDRFLLFRTDREALSVYIPSGDAYVAYDVKPDRAQDLMAALPRLFRIDSHVALPESVPTRYLASPDHEAATNRFDAMERQQRFQFLDKVSGVLGHSDWFGTPQTVQQQSVAIASAMSTLFSTSGTESANGNGQGIPEVELARKLIYQVAGIDRTAIDDLHRALRDGKDGHANGLIQK